MRPRFASAGHTLLGEPLDGAGNRGSGYWLQQAQVRDLRRTRPCARGFPSVACDAPLAWFAARSMCPAARSISQQTPTPQALLRGATVSAVTRYRRVKPARSVTAAQLTELRGSLHAVVESRFFHGVEPERRVRMRPCGDGAATSGRREITDVKLTPTVSDRWRRCSREFPGSLDGT